MNQKLKFYLKEIDPINGERFYCIDIEELSIEIGINLLFRMFLEENGHLMREGCSWLSLKKSQ